MSNLFTYDGQRALLDQRHERVYEDVPTLPEQISFDRAISTLHYPEIENYLEGRPDKDVVSHIADEIVPALSGQKRSSRYYGFVTGGVLPIAEWADNVVTMMDQNVQVHLPDQSISTRVEDVTLRMMLNLLNLGDEGAGEKPDDRWKGRTFTTGATSSNILGLACGREETLYKALRGEGSVAELGLLGACRKVGVKEIQVLTSSAHSSLSKAASVVGLGRSSIKELPLSEKEPWRLDLEALEMRLETPGTVSIIAISAGEVNTGRYSTRGGEMRIIRDLADKYGAWVHVDGAFGIFARALERTEQYEVLHRGVEGLELADSITVDGHKLLNVPYDCGMFFTRSHEVLESVFVNPNAAYLAPSLPSAPTRSASSGSASSRSTSSGEYMIPSPLHIGLENSRRFRALPAYAVLVNEGRPGIASLLANMIELSRKVAAFLQGSMYYELLPDQGSDLDEIFMIVLFRAVRPELNDKLVNSINKTRQMYVSETKWKGQKAVRMAVSTWMVDVERDYKIVKDILTNVAEGREFDIMRFRG
ncbi:pyridoxal phosphate-dependent transferase [Thelonectria olida]|uniref:Pyridoxal phosphate-dependent transferase n=1 Tax=Thelonectria olida TaxID=1576542 RepID=A0A9P8WIG1_9HYPO|nr:pyridoxal phosphate-dependent transferase [Thelonectria olida]